MNAIYTIVFGIVLAYLAFGGARSGLGTQPQKSRPQESLVYYNPPRTEAQPAPTPTKRFQF